MKSEHKTRLKELDKEITRVRFEIEHLVSTDIDVKPQLAALHAELATLSNRLFSLHDSKVKQRTAQAPLK